MKPFTKLGVCKNAYILDGGPKTTIRYVWPRVQFKGPLARVKQVL